MGAALSSLPSDTGVEQHAAIHSEQKSPVESLSRAVNVSEQHIQALPQPQQRQQQLLLQQQGREESRGGPPEKKPAQTRTDSEAVLGPLQIAVRNDDTKAIASLLA